VVYWKTGMVAFKANLPSLTQEVVDDLVGRLVKSLSPQRIVLFGSRARGTNRPDSDVDLLVIAESALPRDRRAAVAYGALAGAPISADIDVMVYTPFEAEQWSGVPAAFVTTALREGKVLYEQEHR
jgi:hypothetical protein